MLLPPEFQFPNGWSPHLIPDQSGSFDGGGGFLPARIDELEEIKYSKCNHLGTSTLFENAISLYAIPSLHICLCDGRPEERFGNDFFCFTIIAFDLYRSFIDVEMSLHAVTMWRPTGHKYSTMGIHARSLLPPRLSPSLTLKPGQEGSRAGVASYARKRGAREL